MAQTSFATTPLQIVTNVRVYKPFEGANAEQMQRLLTGKENDVQVDAPRLPISPKQFMEARLGRLGTEADQAYLRSVYANMNTAVLPHPKGSEVKYVHEHPLIYTLTPETRLVNGNLPLTQLHYDHSEGFVLNETEAQALRNDPNALPRRRREFWEFTAEGDTKLTTDYINDVEKTLGLKFNQVMGLFLPTNKGLRLLCVGRIGYDWSYASGNYDLGLYYGRLVGVAAEPHVVTKKIETAKKWQASLEAKL